MVDWMDTTMVEMMVQILVVVKEMMLVELMGRMTVVTKGYGSVGL